MEYVLEARALGKRYVDVAALDGVDLALPAGAVHGLLGPNGAGKTTLLSILLGLIHADAGTARIEGRVAGFVETPRFYPYLSVHRNLQLLASYDDERDETRIAELATVLGLPLAAKAGALSVGMRQRLGLASALLRDPAVLVLDEPATGLDPAAQQDLRRLLRELASDGTTVVLSSHDVDEVEDLCESVTVLKTGRVVFDGTIDALRAAAPPPFHRMDTSDNHAAEEVAAKLPGTDVHADDGTLAVVALQRELDDFVIALGHKGIAVRSLQVERTSLRSMFFELTR